MTHTRKLLVQLSSFVIGLDVILGRSFGVGGVNIAPYGDTIWVISSSEVLDSIR